MTQADYTDMLRKALEAAGKAYVFTPGTTPDLVARENAYCGIVAALALAPPSDAPRPMSEAPRNGKPVLLYRKLGEIPTIKTWDPEWQRWRSLSYLTGDDDYCGWLPVPGLGE